MQKITIRQRADGNGWLIDYRWGPRRIRETRKTKSAAQDRKSVLLSNIREYGHPDPVGVTEDSWTVDEILDRWIADLPTRGLTSRTIAGYKGHASRVRQIWGNKRLSELNAEVFEDWVRQTSGEYALTYQKHLVRNLTLACKSQRIDDPAKGIRWPRPKRQEVQVYTPAQVQAILDKAPARFKGVVAVLAFVGVRPAEAGRLRMEDIDLAAKAILIPAGKGKTGRRYIEDMPGTVWPWIERYGYNPTNYIRSIAQIAREVDFPWIQDGLRHSFASYMVAKTDASTAMKCTGHVNPYTLHNHYVGVVRKADAEAYFAITPGGGSGTRPGPGTGATS